MTNLILSAEEKTALSYHENIIEKGLETFFEVGQSLVYIRDHQLYREDYKTFSDYCEQKWHFSVRQAQRLMSSTKIIELLEENTTARSHLPTSEYQLRPLGKIKDHPELMTQAWIELTGKTKEEYDQGLRKSVEPTHKEVEEKVKEYEAQIKQLENENKQLKDREKHKDRVIQERNKTFSEVIAKEKELKEKYDLI